MDISNRLNKAIEYKMVTPYNIFMNTGVSESILSRILNGRTKKPQEKTLKKIADYLQISFEWLMNGKGTMHIPIGLMTDDEIAAQDADANVNSGEAVPSIVLNNPSYQNLLNKVQEQAAEIAALNVELKDAYKEISVLQKELRTAEKQ